MNGDQHPLRSPNFQHVLADRMMSIRKETYGEDGIADLATQLRVPARTWANYERGMTIPGQVLLRFLAVTSAEVNWLIQGVGPKYSLKQDQSHPRPDQ